MEQPPIINEGMHPEEPEPENGYSAALTLSEDLLLKWRDTARLGSVFMTALLIVAGLIAVYDLYLFVTWSENSMEEFYLMEAGNLKRVWGFISSFFILYLFARAVWVGRKAFLSLASGIRHDDDNDLLAGMEQIPVLLRWLVIWASFWFVSLLLQYLIF